MVTLAEHEDKWREYLRSEQCPPVLGLVPLEEAERAAIRMAVAAQLAPKFGTFKFDELLRLIEQYPATLATWLAREAGEAYYEGEFWQRFEELIGVTVPHLRRSELARDFRYACGLTMRNFTAAPDKGAFIYVETFLHQAGLPFSHVAHFAFYIRRIERSSGLPAPDDPNSGRELAERLFEVIPHSLVMLRRALRGAAGALICEVALKVIFAGEYGSVNQHLGDELSRQFTSTQTGSLRRSARAPFLRLAADLCALELVGPRQDATIIGARGLCWIVDGRRQPVASFDEFVFPLSDEESVSVELQGLRDGGTLSRAFPLQPQGIRPPCLLFDAETRLPARLPAKGSIAVRAGRYWALHCANHEFSEALERIHWTDAKRALSLIEVRPRSATVLRDEHGTATCEIAAEAAPYFAPVGRRLLTDDGELLHYGWEHLPAIWLPDAATADWTLHLVVSGPSTEIRLTPDLATTAGLLTACHQPDTNPITALPAGLHELTLTLKQRGRVQLAQSFLLWMGLMSADSERFVTSAWPENLLADECVGFDLTAPELRHAGDQQRAHRLVFEIDSTVRRFQWCRPGTFLESFERVPGVTIRPQAESFGAAFSAGTDSARWLRVWRTGTEPAEVLVNGDVLQAFGGEDGRPFVDLSLAHLALLHPQGGTISLRHHSLEVTLARFTRPLAVTTAKNTTTAEARRLDISVGDPVQHARVHFHELLSGRMAESAPVALTDGGTFTPTLEGLPSITVECHKAATGTRLVWSVPRGGWPEGVWVCELELRRAQDTDWQPLATSKGERLPLRAEAEPEITPEGFRARVLWMNVCPHVAVGRLIEDGSELEPALALDLLNELLEWRQRRYHPEVAKYFEWVESLCSWLCRRMGAIINRADDGPALRLLHLASGAAGRRFFIDVPGLIALPASLYQQLVGEAPLIQALARCGRLAASETLISTVASGQADIDLLTLSNFSNFKDLAMRTNAIGPGDEFRAFKFADYWKQTIGTVDATRRDAEWAPNLPALSRTHARWAVTQLSAAYESVAADSKMGGVNALLQTAPSLRRWLQANIPGLPLGAWSAPWIDVSAENNLVPGAAQFASLLALAARAAASGRISFSSVLVWLDEQTRDPDRTRVALTALLELAPELFGFSLIFWEMIFRTLPSTNG